MSSSLSRIARDLQTIISETDSRKTKPFDSEAKVVRVEDDYVYVNFPGGVDETPVRKTIDASVGDSVQVRVSGGRAWLIGNATAPPTDDTTANKALGQANVIFNSVRNLEDTVDAAIDDIDGMASDIDEMDSVLTSTNNHFWVDDNTGAVYVSQANKNASDGYAMRQGATGIALLNDGEVLTSWTGSGQAYYADGERVALYSSGGALIGSENGAQINISSDEFSVIDEDGNEMFNIGASSATAEDLITFTKTFPKYDVSTHMVKSVYFSVPLDTIVSYSGRSTGSFTIAQGDTGSVFSGIVGDDHYYCTIRSTGSSTATLQFRNTTTVDLTFTFSYNTEYDVPLISSTGSLELGGGISTVGSGSIGANLSVTGNVTSANIGAANTTNDTINFIDTGTTWVNSDTYVTLDAGVYILMGRASFDEAVSGEYNIYGKGARCVRIATASGSGYAVSTVETPSTPGSVSTVLHTGVIVWPSAPTTYYIQVRQTSGTDGVEVKTQLRYCRIK